MRHLRLIERRFTTRAAAPATWTHLAHVETWPSWARHLRRVELHPAGGLSRNSTGRIVLRGGIPTTFRVTRLDAGRSWSWRGHFAGTTLDYDHVVVPHDRRAGTDITFTIDGSGRTAPVVGRVFAAVYGRILDRAIPNLVRELDTLG